MGEASAENAAWSYEEPYDEALDVKDYVAFNWNDIDAWMVDDRQIVDQPRNDAPAKANPFVDWLVQRAWQAKTLPEAVQQVAEVLVENGFPLWRLRLIIRTLNPQLFGMAYTSAAMMRPFIVARFLAIPSEARRTLVSNVANSCPLATFVPSSTFRDVTRSGPEADDTTTSRNGSANPSIAADALVVSTENDVKNST